MGCDVVIGPNFSGRSALLKARLAEIGTPGSGFFVGPYAEAALSGLSSTVVDEIAIYAAPAAPARDEFPLPALPGIMARKPATLSGGEQVMLALHCFARSGFDSIGIDTALEQLDPRHRAAALAYLGRAEALGFDAVVTDNRIDRAPASWSRIEATVRSSAFACDLAAVAALLAPRPAPVLTIDNLSFAYRGGPPIFTQVSLTMAPGHAYRLTGPNGAGKSTLFKLIAGVLVPQAGRLALDGAAYAPWAGGNRIFALATQNPDHQWCGATLREDLDRRRAALARLTGPAPPDDTRVAALAAHLGTGSLDQHLYELPLAARKRLSWLWPLSGTLPWVMLDEPTVGQDAATRAALAAAVMRLCSTGHGAMFVTHDDDFAALLPHRELRIAGHRVTSDPVDRLS